MRKTSVFRNHLCVLIILLLVLMSFSVIFIQDAKAVIHVVPDTRGKGEDGTTKQTTKTVDNVQTGSSSGDSNGDTEPPGPPQPPVNPDDDFEVNSVDDTSVLTKTTEIKRFYQCIL